MGGKFIPKAGKESACRYLFIRKYGQAERKSSSLMAAHPYLLCISGLAMRIDDVSLVESLAAEAVSGAAGKSVTR